MTDIGVQYNDICIWCHNCLAVSASASKNNDSSDQVWKPAGLQHFACCL